MKKNLFTILTGVIAAAALLWAAVLQGEVSELRDRTPAPIAECPPPPPEAVPSAAPRSDELAALRHRVGALERRAKRWLALTEKLAGRTAPPETAPEKAGEDGVAALREDVDALLEGEGLNSEEAAAKVRSLMDAERQARVERKRQVQADAEQEWLDEFATDAKLSDEQLTTMQELARVRRDAMFRIWGAVRNGEMSFREGKAEGETLREELEAKLKETLDGDQLEAFWDKFGQDRP